MKLSPHQANHSKSAEKQIQREKKKKHKNIQSDHL